MEPMSTTAKRRHGSQSQKHDDRGLKRLFRYCLRPPFSLDRLRLLPDGRYGYSVKKFGRRACCVRIMTPVECLARLCALVPPPYYPLTRYHGVIAPRQASPSDRASASAMRKTVLVGQAHQLGSRRVEEGCAVDDPSCGSEISW